jgi:hypothetical protein
VKGQIYERTEFRYSHILLIIVIGVLLLIGLLAFVFWHQTLLYLATTPGALSDTFPLVGSFFTALLAIFLGNWAWDRFNRPKLLFEVLPKPVIISVSEENAGSPISLVQPWILASNESKYYDSTAYVYRVAVRNLGRTSAKNSTAYLKWRTKDGNEKTFVLKWESIPEPFNYDNSQEKSKKSLIHSQLSDSTQRLDLLPGKDSPQIIDVFIQEYSFIVELDKEGNVIDDNFENYTVVFSPSHYYTRQLSNIVIKEDDFSSTLLVSYERGLFRKNLHVEGGTKHGKLKMTFENN